MAIIIIIIATELPIVTSYSQHVQCRAGFRIIYVAQLNIANLGTSYLASYKTSLMLV
jgi:hypothetical protein